jgi:hypothetical protein
MAGRPASGHQLSLGRTLRERGVCLFTLDPRQDGSFAAMIARLVTYDAMALFADLCAIPVSGDGLMWINGCELLDRAVLAELVARGRRAGLAVVLSTTSDRAAAGLAADVNVLAVHQMSDPAAASQLASLAVGPASAPSAPSSPAAFGSAYPGSAYPGSAYPGSAYPGSAYPGSDVPGLSASRSAAHAPSGLVGTGPGAEMPAAPVPASVPAWALRMPVPPVPPGPPVQAGRPVSRGPQPPLAPQLPLLPGPDGLFPAAAAAAWDTGSAGAYPLQKNDSPGITPESLLSLPGDRFALIVKGPVRRVSPRCRAIAARLPGGPA